MVFASPYRPLPPLPVLNVHDFLFARKNVAVLQDEFVMHIDGVTGQQRTNKQFYERVRDGATALAAPPSAGGIGLGGQEEIVGILSHNTLDYVVLLHSLLVLTAPMALLSAFATPFELLHALRTARPTHLFVQPELLADALHAAREAGLPAERVYVLEGRVAGRRSFGDMIERARHAGLPRAPVRPAGRDTLAYLMFSSGTTGLPKAVMISHGNVLVSLLQQIMAAATENAARPSDEPAIKHTLLAFLPMYHTFGLHMVCFRGMLAPVTQIFMRKWNMPLALKLIPKHRVTLLYLIPSVLHQLVHDPGFRPDTLASVLYLGCGAAYLPPQLTQRFRKLMRRDVAVLQGFGMSEVTITASRQFAPGVFGDRVPAPSEESAGVLLPGMDGRVVRPDGTDAAPDEPGELWLRGGNVALGYWNNARATAETFVPGGWLRTGDRFRVNAAGHLFFIDRLKDTLKVAGLQVSPTEIEDVLMAHPGQLLADACVGGVSGGRTEDEKVPRAWVVLSDDARAGDVQAALGTLESWARVNLSKYKWLRGGIEVVDEIPKSPTGKVLRRVLQERYEEQLRRPSAKL